MAEASADQVPEYIPAYVAPAFEDQKHFNTVTVRPTYRITLRLGEVDDLFPHAPGTDEGRMERLQYLGLFYFPPNHPKRTDAYKEAWTWIQGKIFKDTKTPDDKILHALRERIITRGEAPFSKLDSGTIQSGLPPAAADPTNPDIKTNFARIRVPGGYTWCGVSADNKFEEWWGLDPFGGVELNEDGSFPNLNFGAHLYDGESYSYLDPAKVPNAMGRIPLVATVETQVDAETWMPVEGAAVYFQLVDPYDPHGRFTGGATVVEQACAPIEDASVDALLGSAATATGYEYYKLDSNDPQGRNCHIDFGGKRGGTWTDGGDVADRIFSIAQVEGFHKGHSNGRKAHRDDNPSPHKIKDRTGKEIDCPLSHYLILPAEQVKPTGNYVKDAHSVRVKTNAEGQAGVIFMPSRMGGDCYRLKVYIGKPTLPTSGAGFKSVSVETGTMVVWRNVRISRMLRKAVALPVQNNVKTDCANWGMATDADILGPWKAYVTDAAGALLGTGGFVDPDMGLIQEVLASAYCELEIDGCESEAEIKAYAPAPIDASEYAAAWSQAKEDAETAVKALGDTEYDISNLMYTQSIAERADSIVLLPLREPNAYNALEPKEKQIDMVPFWDSKMSKDVAGNQISEDDLKSLRQVIKEFMRTGFLRSLSRNGYLPGLTMLLAAHGTTWGLYGLLDHNGWGRATQFRGLTQWLGAGNTDPGGFVSTQWYHTKTTLHEMGHCLYRQHAPGKDKIVVAGGTLNSNNAGDTYAARHDVITKDSAGFVTSGNKCIMSYCFDTLMFCSECILGLRGWNTGPLS